MCPVPCLSHQPSTVATTPCSLLGGDQSQVGLGFRNALLPQLTRITSSYSGGPSRLTRRPRLQPLSLLRRPRSRPPPRRHRLLLKRPSPAVLSLPTLLEEPVSTVGRFRRRGPASSLQPLTSPPSSQRRFEPLPDYQWRIRCSGIRRLRVSCNLSSSELPPRFASSQH